MAKKVFKIPTKLDESYLDLEFNVKSQNGIGLTDPVPAKVILLTLVATFAWFYLVFNTFISKGGIPVIVGFTIAWFVLSIMLFRSDKTGRMGLGLVVTMFNYLPKSGRFVPVRMNDSVFPLQSLLNIRTIDPEDGLIRFLDGQIGHVYHVVGTASTLMFEEDKQIILDKVDTFYRKLPVGVEVIYDTIYEGHAVDEQIESVIEDKMNLKVKSKGLDALLDEQFNILSYAINNNQGLTSLHQYLVVRSPNESDLRDFENLLHGDVDGNGLMFRLAKPLTYSECKKYFKSILGGVGVSDEKRVRVKSRVKNTTNRKTIMSEDAV